MHRIMKADGLATGGDHDRGREAVGLPAVGDGVMGLLAPKRWRRWKMNQVALATLRTPKGEGD